MCGIHGFISVKKNINADDFVNNGFVAGSLRGVDAAGIASIKAGTRDCVYQKLAVPGPMFIEDRYAKNLIKQASEAEIITICHTRSSTTGTVNGGINDAHPFTVYTGEREMIGVHNGTLTGWYNKPKANGFKVDSEWALNHIFDKGMDAFKDFAGSYCFAWWDSDHDKVLNFALNKDRPMNIAFTQDGGMAFASEPGMLYWLMERNRIKLKGKVLELQSNHWYKFDVDKLDDYDKDAIPANVSETVVRSHHSSSRSSHSTYQQGSTVEKIDAMLATIYDVKDDASTPVTQQTTLALPAPASVSDRGEELNKAKKAGMLNELGLFEPMQLDTKTGDIDGIMYLKDTEFSATMRNAGHYQWDKETLWEVTCLGMVDTGQDVNLIVGHPHKQPVLKRAVTATRIQEEVIPF